MEVRNLKRQLDEARGEAEKYEREYDLNKAAELKYGVIPNLESKIKEAVRNNIFWSFAALWDYGLNTAFTD